jgi:hypothetical protein
MPTPAVAAQTNSSATPHGVTCPPSAESPLAVMAVPRATRAVASFSRDSPSRIVTTRRGRELLRATAVAATASGGATTAPSANATAKGTGSISHETSPTPAAVNRTSPTESPAMATRWALRSISEVPIAVA